MDGPGELGRTSNHLTTIGIVGLGKMGILHAGILNALPNSKVVAVCEKESMLTRLAKKVLPSISFYDNVTEMSVTICSVLAIAKISEEGYKRELGRP